jgi:hypothetical protein
MLRHLLPLLLTTPAAAADTVCVGVPDAQVSATAAEGEHPAAVGTLAPRQCFAVTARTPGRTRIFVNAPKGFTGDLEIADASLAWVLVDDADLRHDPKEEPWGHLLSGALLQVERRLGSDMVMVRTLEGQLSVRFVVPETGIFPAAAWSEPDPDDRPRGAWPTATLAPLPVPGNIWSRSMGGEVRAILGGPMLEIRDLALDPGQGELKWEPVKKTTSDLQARLVQRNLWVEGFLHEIEWRADVPPLGWPPEAGTTKKPIAALPTREIGETAAPISRAVKGKPFGQLPSGTRVEVSEEDGNWVGVEARWFGGSVKGWIEKKRLVKEGKESAAPASPQRWAQVGLSDPTLEWATPEGHDTPAELDTTVLIRGLRDAMPSLRRAYAKALSRKPDATGLVTLKLVVDPSGAITDATAPVATFDDAEFRDLALAIVKTQPLPKRKVVRKKNGPTDWNIVVWVPLTLQSR